MHAEAEQRSPASATWGLPMRLPWLAGLAFQLHAAPAGAVLQSSWQPLHNCPCGLPNAPSPCRRGVCILLFNPVFRLLGSQPLPLRAVLFATWGGLRWAPAGLAWGSASELPHHPCAPHGCHKAGHGPRNLQPCAAAVPEGPASCRPAVPCCLRVACARLTDIIYAAPACESRGAISLIM